jgi:propionyl-CoA carboxylase alpha chain
MSSTTITRLLVANRGEIARRVFRTCRDLGIETVAVYSDADAAMPFVREADAAVHLPGNTPAETYLRGDLIIDAAKATGADAIHPGYGFLSENAVFAQQVIDAGLTWVGPTPSSMEQMATKVEAKQLMAEAGVPVLTELDPTAITAADLPVLVKASSGGGGRGMRVVRDLAVIEETVALASSEAASAFGDPTVFCEPYVERGRHVEVQVVGDTHGNVVVLGERDCSLQRRHQKVVEETPAPGLSQGTREALHEAARLAAKAIGYVGAGTVEFLLAGGTAAARFYFLEMNTRLQVEHPVTECVTHLDLVALQIEVAEGRSLAGVTPVVDGHAVEVRLYAEDPAAGWQPQSGRLTRFEVPGVVAELANPSTYGVRLDSGVAAGDEIGTHYDAMIAKVIAWAPTRDQALRQLAGTLSRSEIHGLTTNRDLLIGLLRDERVIAGDVSTDLLDAEDIGALSGARADGATQRALFAAAIALAERRQRASTYQSRIPAGWRNVTSQPHTTKFELGGDEVVVSWFGGRDGYSSADVEGLASSVVGETEVVLSREGISRRLAVRIDGYEVNVDSVDGHVALRALPRFADPADQVAQGSLLAPMPGTVVAVPVEVGQHVSAGTPILVLEAMKMQHTVSAPQDGVVAELAAKVGQQVSAGDVLAVVTDHGETDD